jgi:iron complex transport system substrate-binding protein
MSASLDISLNVTTSYPHRIICLTAETTELIYALGAGDRIVGVSGYTMRPPEARKKPKISAFTTAKIDAILELKPDLVLAFSDLQADIAKDLIKKGINVLALNQRSLSETLQTALWIGRILGIEDRAKKYVQMFQEELDGAKAKAATFSSRPKIYFEEWDDPLISGIAWVDEIITIAGGIDVFSELSAGTVASQRVVQAQDVINKDPDIIVASWCGKKAQLEKIAARPGWDKIQAVKNKQLFEIKSPDILQPGPSLLRGLRQTQAIIENYLALEAKT